MEFQCATCSRKFSFIGYHCKAHGVKIIQSVVPPNEPTKADSGGLGESQSCAKCSFHLPTDDLTEHSELVHQIPKKRRVDESPYPTSESPSATCTSLDSTISSSVSMGLTTFSQEATLDGFSSGFSTVNTALNFSLPQQTNQSQLSTTSPEFGPTSDFSSSFPHSRNLSPLNQLSGSTVSSIHSDSSNTSNPFLGLEFGNNALSSSSLYGDGGSASSQISDFALMSNNQSSQLNNELLMCLHCNASFALTDEYDAHMTLHFAPNRRFSCARCHKSFVKKLTLESHLCTHRNRAPFQCSQCRRNFLYEDSYQEHLRIHPELRTSRMFRCQKCSKTFTSKTLFKRHQRTHMEMQYPCLECPVAFHKRIDLQIHKLSHHSTVAQLFQCAFCSAQFHQKHELSSHELTHGLGNMHMLVATDGGSQTTRLGNYQCRKCLTNYPDQQNLQRHLLTHVSELGSAKHSRIDAQAPCTQCGKWFIGLQELLKHNEEFHQQTGFSNSRLQQRLLPAHVPVII